MKRSADIDNILHPLDRTPLQAYISNALQVADILEWIFAQTEVSDDVTVYQTTFSISEEFLRRTYFIRQRHPARYIVIIDRKALNKTVSLWKFISQVYDEVWISDNHSKLLIVDSPARRVALVTSQNLTRGNRAESAVLTTDPAVTASLLENFFDLRSNNSAPMHEIMNIPHNDSQEPLSMLEHIERLASYFVPVSDIAVILEIDENRLRALIADPETPESRAYRRGKACSKVSIRAQEMELARVGSPLGMQSVRENLLLMEQDED